MFWFVGSIVLVGGSVCVVFDVVCELVSFVCVWVCCFNVFSFVACGCLLFGVVSIGFDCVRFGRLILRLLVYCMYVCCLLVLLFGGFVSVCRCVVSNGAGLVVLRVCFLFCLCVFRFRGSAFVGLLFVCALVVVLCLLLLFACVPFCCFCVLRVCFLFCVW